MINIGLKYPITEYAIKVNSFIDFVHTILLGVFFFVLLSLGGLLLLKRHCKLEGIVYQKTELCCISFPFIFVLVQLFYGVYLLYIISSLDTTPVLTIKIIGNQWYWRYEVADIPGLCFDRFIKLEHSLGDYRLLSVDNRLVVPVNVPIRLAITSYDVIHSFALPNACIKVDAVPGILNCITVKFSKVGVFYGQCREICGANHRFIPICLEVTLWESWVHWAYLNSDLC